MNNHELDAVVFALKGIAETLTKEQKKIARARYQDLVTDKVKRQSDEENDAFHEARVLLYTVFD